jgi:hypothetical protein
MEERVGNLGWHRCWYPITQILWVTTPLTESAAGKFAGVQKDPKFRLMFLFSRWLQGE